MSIIISNKEQYSIVNLYNLGKSCTALKHIFKRDMHTISNILKRNNIKIRTDTIIDVEKETLNNLYTINKKSCREIGLQFGCSKRPILRLLKKYGIRIRKNGEDKAGKPSWNKGIPASPKVRELLRNYRKGKKDTEETKLKKGKAHKGLKYKKWSAESRKNLSIAKKGKPGHRLGKKASAETLKKLRDSHLGIKPSEETRKKLSISLENRWSNNIFYRTKMLSLTNLMSNTKPELIIFNYYISKGYIEGETIIKQYYIKGVGSADFYLPKENTLIFVDGDWWHCNPSHPKFGKPCYYHPKVHKFSKQIWDKDKKITEKCIALGFNVIRIWEKDVNFFVSTGG